MTHDPSIRPDAANLAAGTSESARAPRKSDGVAFKELIDRLEMQTQRLRQDGDSRADPAELAGAVDRAKNSIEDAISLSEELMEAFRASQISGEASRETTSEEENAS